MAVKRWLAPVNAYIDGTKVLTEGGCEVSVGYETAEVKDDDHGVMPVDIILTGLTASVKLNLADISMEALQKVFPAATMIGTGSTGRLEFRPGVGTSLLDSAVELVLKKVVAGIDSTDKSDWITAPIAVPTGKASLAMTKDKQMVPAFEFRCLPDDTHSGRALFFGDVNAS